MLNIEFARGDSYERGFLVKRGGQTVTDAFDDIFFTVKKSYRDKEFILQKKLSDGSIRTDGDGHYTLVIRSADTDNLAFGEYDCDIEFLAGEYKKTFIGKLTLNKEVTYTGNE